MSSRDLAIANLLRDMAHTVAALAERVSALEAERPKPSALISLLKGNRDTAH